MTNDRFEVVRTTTGAVSIRCTELNEIMHNPVGPWIEANSLYIEQSGLRERLLTGTGAELVLFDVGLGAAANSLAVLHLARSLGENARPLKLVSFERDLELLRFALANSSQFDHFAGFEQAIATLLSDRQWSQGSIQWTLHEGDFLTEVGKQTARPHLVYYDPYSQKVDRNLWTTAAFKRLREFSRDAVDGATSLYTYSQSTPVRVALLQAGFYVGRGIPTGLKETTTQASTRFEDLASPLDLQWLEKWKRSHLKHAFDCAPEFERESEAFVLAHPQFNLPA